MRIGKLISAIAGVMLLIAGFGMSVAGGFALAVPDDDGWVSVGPARVRTEAAAIVGDDINIDLGNHVNDGRTFVSWDAIATEITIDDRNGKDVFIGVGPESAVDAYLAGTAMVRADWHDDDINVDDFVAGGPAADPTDQDFWIASSTDGVLEWDVADGDWAVAVVNADGSPGIDIAVTGAAEIPFLRAIGVGLLAGGLLFLAGGATLTYLGVRASRERTGYTTPQAPPAGPVVA
jgi:hypothetical protein